MTPQLQQAIKLLQLSRLELLDLVQQELEENPVLEESLEQDESKDLTQVELQENENSPDDISDEFREISGGSDILQDVGWDNYLDGYNSASGEQYNDEDRRVDNYLTKKESLFEHLEWQLHMSQFSEEESRIGLEIIGDIDDDGYLRTPLEEIATICSVTVENVENVLRKIQEFDPPGVAARNMQECLMEQIRQLGLSGSLVDLIVKDHLTDIEAKRYKQIAKALKVSVNEVIAVTKVISGLNPKPGLAFETGDVEYISPDVYVYKIDGEYVVVLNDEGLPMLHISPYYSDVRAKGMGSEAEEYVNEKTKAAFWLIKSIQQRQRTILKTAKSIVKFQREFFDYGIEYLKPLILKDVAEDISMHESTISRVTTNKYMHTPQGIFEMKYFFNSGISTGDGDFVASESVKKKIRELIDGENPAKPYSDLTLAKILSDANINIARRTVTKYREMMRIGSSSERRKSF